eukprot:31163-Pelagococcus_subviridis.AAC.2
MNSQKKNERNLTSSPPVAPPVPPSPPDPLPDPRADHPAREPVRGQPREYPRRLLDQPVDHPRLDGFHHGLDDDAFEPLQAHARVLLALAALLRDDVSRRGRVVEEAEPRARSLAPALAQFRLELDDERVELREDAVFDGSDHRRLPSHEVVAAALESRLRALAREERERLRALRGHGREVRRLRAQRASALLRARQLLLRARRELRAERLGLAEELAPRGVDVSEPRRGGLRRRRRGRGSVGGVVVGGHDARGRRQRGARLQRREEFARVGADLK